MLESCQGRWVELAGLVLLVKMYFFLNSLLNLVNKWALGWFSFPLLMTASHMAFCFLMLAPVMLAEPMRSKHIACLIKQWKGLILVGVSLGLNIALNNTALVHMTLSLNQVIRSSIPVFTALISVFIEHKIPSMGESVALFILSGGVMLAVWQGTAAGAPSAILLCILGTISNAGMMSLSGKVLSEKVDVLQLTFYTAPVSCVALLPAVWAREWDSFMDYRSRHGNQSYAIIIGTSAVALAYNVVHALMIKRTSAVTTTVLGQAKVIGLLILSYLLLGEKKVFTVNMTIGTVSAIFGICLYTHFKLQNMREAQDAGQAAKELPDSWDAKRKPLLPESRTDSGISRLGSQGDSPNSPRIQAVHPV